MRIIETYSADDVYAGGDERTIVRVATVDVELRLMLPIAGDADRLIELLVERLAELSEPVGDSEVVVLSAREHDGADR